MATYVNNLRLKEIATGAESGTWGTSTNTNLELIADAFGSGTEAITTNADTHTTTIADGSADEGRAIYMKYTGTLDSTCTITLAPNTINKLWIIENATGGSQDIAISQGSGANITIGNGNVSAIFTDGAGSGAAVLDALADLELSSTLTVAGAVTMSGDASVGDDLTLVSDAAILNFGVNSDVNLTHVPDTGLLLNSTMQLQFNDSSQFINAPSATVLDINATDEIELNATAVDLNGTLDVSGASTLTGAVTASGGITSTASSNTFGATSFNDAAITNVGDIALDSISSDGSAIGIGASGDTVTCEGAWIFNEGSNDVDFRIESNGDANMFFVDAGNDKIGIGTATPTGKFEIYTGDASVAPDSSADDIVIESSGSAGISILTGTSNSGSIMFGDSGDNGRGKLYYDHNTDAMKFATSGSVAITIASDGELYIEATKRILFDGGGNTYIKEDSADVLRCVAGGSGGVDLTSGATSWASASDMRVKVESELEPITDALTKVSSLRSVIGRYIADPPDRRRAFLIGQEVQAVLPEAVTEGPDGILSLAYTETIPLLVAALNEGFVRIMALEAELAELQGA